MRGTGKDGDSNMNVTAYLTESGVILGQEKNNEIPVFQEMPDDLNVEAKRSQWKNFCPDISLL